MKKRTKVTREQAPQIPIASLIFTGRAGTAYAELDSSLPAERARALAAEGSVRALSRTFANLLSGTDTTRRNKFTGYLNEMNLDELYGVFMAENNFATLLYTGFGPTCIPKLKGMEQKQQVAVLQRPDAIAQLITKGEKAFVREVAECLPEAERDALFAGKKWDSGTAITFESLIDKPAVAVKLTAADNSTPAPAPASLAAVLSPN